AVVRVADPEVARGTARADEPREVGADDQVWRELPGQLGRLAPELTELGHAVPAAQAPGDPLEDRLAERAAGLGRRVPDVAAHGSQHSAGPSPARQGDRAGALGPALRARGDRWPAAGPAGRGCAGLVAARPAEEARDVAPQPQAERGRREQAQGEDDDPPRERGHVRAEGDAEPPL